MTFKPIIAAFIAQIRGAIRKLPLPEQMEAGSESRWAINELVGLGNRLDLQFPVPSGEVSAMAEEFGKQFDAAVQELIVSAVAEAEAKYSTYVPKEAHELALAQAKENALKEGRELALAEISAQAEAQKNRARIIEAGLPKSIAEKIPDSALVGAAAEASVSMMTGRVNDILGITKNANEELFSACAEALDEEGQKRFNGYITFAKNAMPKTATSGKAQGNPMTFPSEAAEQGGGRPRLRI
jgi:hypothetical protein